MFFKIFRLKVVQNQSLKMTWLRNYNKNIKTTENISTDMATTQRSI